MTRDAAAPASRGGRSLRPEVDYARLLGPDAWRRLPLAVRHRFERDPRREVTYVGVFERVSLSPAGRLLARLCRPLGEPLVVLTGRCVPAHVRVFHDGGGTVWERAYHFPGRRTRIVRSAKRAGRTGELLECLGFGLHMSLSLHERGGELQFRSRGYFWKVCGVRVPLPRRWLPGETLVSHGDLGGGRFRFTFVLRHPLLGELARQEGAFREQP